MSRIRRNSRSASRQYAGEAKTPGIKEIAKAAGVSIGTVDRALHSRPGINAKTHAKILSTAQRLGYRPNLAARYLKLNRQHRIAVHLPQEIAVYFDVLRDGIRQAAEQLKPNLKVEFCTYPGIGHGEVESLQALLAEGCDGLILAPCSLPLVAPLIREATSRGMPVVCAATDAPDTGRLTAVSCNAFASGAIAAELLGRGRQERLDAAVITGSLETVDHSEKVRGFRSMLAELQSLASLVEVAEAHDEYSQAYRLTQELLASYPRLTSLYVGTANSLPVVKALEDSGQLNRIDLVVTDLFPKIAPLIRTGKILASIYQRPLTQGRMAFEMLYQFLMEGKLPQPAYTLTPQIILRSNVDLFVDRSSSDVEGAYP